MTLQELVILVAPNAFALALVAVVVAMEPNFCVGSGCSECGCVKGDANDVDGKGELDDDVTEDGKYILWGDLNCSFSIRLVGMVIIVFGWIELPIPPAAKRPINVCRAAARATLAFGGFVDILEYDGCF